MATRATIRGVSRTGGAIHLTIIKMQKRSHSDLAS